jgi:sulfur carrier protein
MEITVAGVKKEYPDALPLTDLIRLEEVATPEYVTVAINEEFVEGKDIQERILKQGDSVEFLYFMGGGRG